MIVGSARELEVYGVIATGGMATIEYARLATPAGWLELAIKRPHSRFAREADFARMFMDEAKLSLRIQHANVVRTLGVLEQPNLALVLEYIQGESLCDLLRTARSAQHPVPAQIATALIAGALHGLHAAHQTCGEDGQPLHIVHRDVTPDNILVGVDGIVRVLDFGIAKALVKLRCTPSGELKGKLAYISPEQAKGQPATRRTDVYGAAVVLWETLAGRQLFGRPHEAATLDAVLKVPVPSIRELRCDLPAALDQIVAKALARDPQARFESAQAMARALETEVGVAPQSTVIDWMEQLAGPRLRERSAQLRAMHQQPTAASIDAARGVSAPAPDGLEPGRGVHGTRVSVPAAASTVPSPATTLLRTTVASVTSLRARRRSSRTPRRWTTAVAAASLLGLGSALALDSDTERTPAPLLQPVAADARIEPSLQSSATPSEVPALTQAAQPTAPPVEPTPSSPPPQPTRQPAPTERQRALPPARPRRPTRSALVEISDFGPRSPIYSRPTPQPLAAGFEPLFLLPTRGETCDESASRASSLEPGRVVVARSQLH